MLEQTLPLLGIFLLGVLLKKLGWIGKEDGQVISRLLMWLLVPATIVHAIWTAEITPRLLLLPLAGVAVVLALLASGVLLAPLLGLHGPTKGAFLVSFPTMECGSLGYAVMAAAFGSAGLAAIVLFDLGNACCFLLLIPIITTLFGQRTGPFRLSEVGKRMLRLPLVWAFALGVILNVCHVHLVLLSNLLSLVASGLLFLVMLLIGLECEGTWSSLLLLGLAMYLKLGIGISVGLLVSLLFGLTGVARIAVVLASSLPASLLTAIVAKESKLDTQFVASLFSLALPVSIVVSLIFTLLPK